MEWPIATTIGLIIYFAKEIFLEHLLYNEGVATAACRYVPEV